tara:strand:- start:78 stop:365 length:288 start_codon:yes stop_codon:yes gene_type:complete
MEKINLKVSLIQDLTNKVEWSKRDLQKAEQWLDENPRSFKAKEEFVSKLRTKQCYESILFHLREGCYESQEFYEKYIEPTSEHVQWLNKETLLNK